MTQSHCSFSAPKGCCLVATNFVAQVSEHMDMFQCPEGLLLGRNICATSRMNINPKFQCPEGLLLGRNLEIFPEPLTGEMFQCPEGLLLGRNDQ